MAKQTQSQDVILNLQVNEQDMLKELGQARKAIVETREDLQALNKAYREGDVNIDEYSDTLVLLEGQLKEEQAIYKNLTKAIDANNTSLDGQRKRLALLTQERNKLDKTTKEGIKRFDELNKEIKSLNDEIAKHEQAGGDFRRNVGNYGSAAKDAAANINVAGVSIGDLTTKLASFANPATAAIAATTALVGLYAKSTTGAKDFAFAQDRAAAAIGVLAEGLGKLVGGGGSGGGGGGLVSALLDTYLNALKFVPVLIPFRKQVQGLIDDSQKAAEAAERLRTLELSTALGQGFNKDDERRAELQRRIRDDEAKSLDERLAATYQIDKQFEQIQVRTTSILTTQAQAIKENSKNYENDLEAQVRVSQIQSEIRDKEEEITGKLTENVNARRAILKLMQDEVDLMTQEVRNANAPSGGKASTGSKAKGSEIVDQDRIDAQERLSISEYLNRGLVKLDKDKDIQIIRNKNETQEKIKKLEEQGLQATANILDQAASLAEEGSAFQQALSITSALIKTYEAANVALASAPPPFNYVLMAATIATGLVNVGKIAGFADGGYTGHGGRTEPAGIVHRGEVVWNQVDVARVGGPEVANAMRPTAKSRRAVGREYVDGGIVTNAAVQQSNTQMVTANILKNAPAPEVSVKEITKVQRRITVKENTSRTRPRS